MSARWMGSRSEDGSVRGNDGALPNGLSTVQMFSDPGVNRANDRPETKCEAHFGGGANRKHLPPECCGEASCLGDAGFFRKNCSLFIIYYHFFASNARESPLIATVQSQVPTKPASRLRHTQIELRQGLPLIAAAPQIAASHVSPSATRT